jgi:hypothetical protein
MKREVLMLMTAKMPSNSSDMPIVMTEIIVESFVRVNPDRLSLTV